MNTVHLLNHEGVAELRLDNPDKLNALTPEMLSQLEQHCAELEHATNIHAVLLTAEGDRAFCVGADVYAWSQLTPFDFARHWVREGHRILDRLARLSKPTIAVISGHAFGGGLELTAACDVRLMSPSATLAMPETGVGIVPGWSGTQRLVRQMPASVVKELVLFGRRLSAERARQIGFIAEIDNDPRARALTFAADLTTKSPRATEIAKYMLGAALGENTETMIEALGGGMMASSEDKTEGINAFREKRPPNFNE
jgi:enoyl-CoA hydratase/carnithine racemase